MRFKVKKPENFINNFVLFNKDNACYYCGGTGIIMEDGVNIQCYVCNGTGIDDED